MKKSDTRYLRAIEQIERQCDYLRMELGFATRGDVAQRSAPKASHVCDVSGCYTAFHSAEDLVVHRDMEHGLQAAA
jgi:hypothetical protein